MFITDSQSRLSLAEYGLQLAEWCAPAFPHWRDAGAGRPSDGKHDDPQLLRGRQCYRGQDAHHTGHDSLLLVTSQQREHRQRNDLRSRSLGNGEVSGLVPERRIGLLQMQWNWIVDPRTDPCLRKMPHEAFAVRDADHEK